MARARKKGHFLNCKITDNILKRLNEYSEKTRIPKTSVVELALIEYLDKNLPDTVNVEEEEAEI